MTFMVPFDGSDLSLSALVKARVCGNGVDSLSESEQRILTRGKSSDVVAVSVIPNSARYAIEKGWVNEREEFTIRRVAEQLHRTVTDFAPSAQFQYERIDGSVSAGMVGRRLRKKAFDLNTSTVFIGSENAGRIVSPVSSVGRTVSADERYDIYIVQTPIPSPMKARIRAGFHPRQKE